MYLVSGGSKPPKAGDPAPSRLVLGAQTTPEQAHASLIPLLARTGISTLKAVKEGRSFGIWHNYYNSPYNVLAVQFFAKSFYPEKFADLDLQQTQKQLYKQFLAIEPTGTYWTD